MSGSGIAVKAFILNGKGELLLIRREKSDPHNPGTWEVPGGRLGLGENPFEGLSGRDLTVLRMIVRQEVEGGERRDGPGYRDREPHKGPPFHEG